MKVIIAGSRSIDWPSFIQMWDLLPKDIPKLFTEVVSGGAKGPDSHGEVIAKHNGLGIKRFIPSWTTLGKKAGILRNVDMGEYADSAIVFWDGESRGSLHMFEFMKSEDKPAILLTKKGDKFDMEIIGEWK